MVLIPSLAILSEPSTTELFWELRNHSEKKACYNLNYFSDEALLQLKGFEGACTNRMKYIPFMISNTTILQKRTIP
jgi:hypothetical protein